MASVEMLNAQPMGEVHKKVLYSPGSRRKEDSNRTKEWICLEVATDKVDTEVPSIHGGILKKDFCQQKEMWWL